MGAVVLALSGVALGWGARGVLAERELAQERSSAAERVAALRSDVAALERERAEFARAQALAQSKAQEEAARWRDKARQAEAGLTRARQELARTRATLQEEIDRAEVAVGARCELGAEWVRIYDDALRAAGGGADGAAGAATGGADGAAGAAEAAVDEWSVMRLHVDNAALWGECRARLSALQAWVMEVTGGR